MVAPWLDLVKEGAMAQVFGGGKDGSKIAKYILAVQRGELDAKLESSPADELEPPKNAPKKKPVPPTNKRRRCQPREKATAQASVNPLAENEMSGATGEEILPAPSESVKVNQSDIVGHELPNPGDQ